MTWKFTLAMCGALIVLAGTLAFRTLDDTAAMLKKIGIDDQEAKQNIFSSMRGKYLAYSHPDMLKAIARGDRPGIVRQIVAYAKAYSRSDEFKRQYDQVREENKPAPPDPPKSMAQQRADQKEQLKKAIADAEEGMKVLAKEQQDAMKPMMEQLRAQLKDVDNPNNPMFSTEMENYGKQAYAAALEDHKQKIEQWKEEYPESPTSMVRSFLVKFLEETADVDYSAKLINGPNGRKLFASTEHEMKSGQWKMCYRAGKETVEAGRVAARQWLGELNGTK